MLSVSVCIGAPGEGDVFLCLLRVEDAEGEHDGGGCGDSDCRRGEDSIAEVMGELANDQGCCKGCDDAGESGGGEDSAGVETGDDGNEECDGDERVKDADGRDDGGENGGEEDSGDPGSDGGDAAGDEELVWGDSWVEE